jgi:hypothetical protein
MTPHERQEDDRRKTREFLDAVRETHPNELPRLYEWFAMQMWELVEENRNILKMAQNGKKKRVQVTQEQGK